MIPSKLANFLNKGGKVIMYHGGSDPRISPFQSIWFYEELASLHGGGYRHTQDSARLFIVPGMGHCGGGVAPNSFDTLQALDNWVTNGVARRGSSRQRRTAGRCPSASSRRRRAIRGREMSTSPPTGPAIPPMSACYRSEETEWTAGADPATALEFLYEAIGLNGQ